MASTDEVNSMSQGPRRAIVGRTLPSDPLSTKFADAQIGPPAGGIRAASHPEFSRPTTIDNTVSAMKAFWNKMHAPRNNPAPPVSPDPFREADSLKSVRAEGEKYLRK